MAQRRQWKRRVLGRTGLSVTTVGIGSAWLGHNGEGSFDEATGAETVLRGLESGINYIDTSGAYIGGRSEQFVGRALKEWFATGNSRADLVISTKTGTRVRPHDYSYDFTMRSVETSLEAMGLDYIDILLVHDPESLDPVFAPGGALSALQKLKEDGVIGFIGLGCRPHEFHRRCIESGQFDMSLTFRDYNLLDQSAAAGVIEPAVAGNVGIVNASIMLSGYLGGAEPRSLADRAKYHGHSSDTLVDRAQRLWDWCRERELDLGTLNLNFCLRDERIASTVLGFSTPERVEQNVEAAFAPIPEEIWSQLYRDFEFD